jgi:DNA polymerase III epsilon subunit-like protein
MHLLFFDLETTGLLPKGMKTFDLMKKEHFPYIVQISWQLQKYDGKTGTFTLLSEQDYIIKPTKDYVVSPESSKIHGISHEQAATRGVPVEMVLRHFLADWILHYTDTTDTTDTTTHLVCHNVEFDVPILLHHIMDKQLFKEHTWLFKEQHQRDVQDMTCVCTMLDTVTLCKKPFKSGGSGYKYPSLLELFECLFQKAPQGQLHNSRFDVECTVACFKELCSRHAERLRVRTIVLGENTFETIMSLI